MTKLPANLSFSELEQRIDSIFSMAELTKETSEATSRRLLNDIILPLKEIFANGRYKHTTYARAYADGYISAKRKYVMNNLVEFCYLFEGDYYSIFKETTHRRTDELYASGMGYVLNKCPSGFLWKGTNKLYTDID